MTKHIELAWRRQRGFMHHHDSDFAHTCPETLAKLGKLSIGEWLAQFRAWQRHNALAMRDYIFECWHTGAMPSIEIGNTRAALMNAAARFQPAQTFQTGAGPIDMTRACRQCGCTEIRACVDERGPCWWAEPDLCSHCAAPHPNPCPPGDLKPDGYQVNEAD
ncbi:hypothetical protein [Maricaulis maris]|uniref:Uncharacterized protein n=1 Tax=Maricaulis maris TaxID=74318 RepID=A0A495D3C1_9PROT|nr:hypothetical protein [Maricaulis maris]RKQ95460.1 hypothetical protein C7435_2562 [Maricaulis maris]